LKGFRPKIAIACAFPANGLKASSFPVDFIHIQNGQHPINHLVSDYRLDGLIGSSTKDCMTLYFFRGKAARNSLSGFASSLDGRLLHSILSHFLRGILEISISCELQDF
jgi:hypothetical protein